MPGYRQILSENQEKEYTIDNEKIYEKAYARRQAKLSAQSQGPGEDSSEEDLIQDIVPSSDSMSLSQGSVTGIEAADDAPNKEYFNKKHNDEQERVEVR